jgi:hypothetical protein
MGALSPLNLLLRSRSYGVPSSRQLKVATIVVLFSFSLGACTAPIRHYKAANHWSKEGYVLEGEALGHAETQKYPDHDASPRLAKSAVTLTPPLNQNAATSKNGGQFISLPPTRAQFLKEDACLRALETRGVRFTALSELRGVENPVEIHGTLGGVEFWANDRRPFQMDCRLALALQDLKGMFKEHGLKRARYSGSYSFRRTGTGRLSHHALGLAIDIHDLTIEGREFSVQGGYEKGVGCPAKTPLNRLACAMRSARLFEEFLTPDFNSDHRDHLHISVPRRR